MALQRQLMGAGQAGRPCPDHSHLAARGGGTLEQRCTTGGHEGRSEEHTSELQSQSNLVCRLLLEKKKNMFFCRKAPDNCTALVYSRVWPRSCYHPARSP